MKGFLKVSQSGSVDCVNGGMDLSRSIVKVLFKSLIT